MQEPAEMTDIVGNGPILTIFIFRQSDRANFAVHGPDAFASKK